MRYHRVYFLLSGSMLTLGGSSVVLMPHSVAGYLVLGVSASLYLLGVRIENNGW